MQHKLILVDDELLFREGLKRILIEFGNFEIVQEASNGLEIINNILPSDEFDLILLDLSMPEIDGIEVLKTLISRDPSLKIAILSSHYDPGIIVKLIELGAASFFAKNEKPAELIDGINNIIERGFHYSPYIIKLLRDKMVHGISKSNIDNSLSDREIEILQKICEQKTAKEIGQDLFISSRTVEGHRKNLLDKTNSKNIAGLVIYALEHGHYRMQLDELTKHFTR